MAQAIGLTLGEGTPNKPDSRSKRSAITDGNTANTDQKPSKATKIADGKGKGKPDGLVIPTATPCNHCGRDLCNRPNATCIWKDGKHPGVNLTATPWKDSAAAKAYVGSPHPHKAGEFYTTVPAVLPSTGKLAKFSDKDWDLWLEKWTAYRKEKQVAPTTGSSASSAATRGGRGGGRGRGGKKGKTTITSIDPLLHLAQAVYDDPDPAPKRDPDWLYYCRTVDPKARTNRDFLKDNPYPVLDLILQPLQDERDLDEEIHAKCLIDGGAGAHNYMSPDMADRLVDSGSKPNASYVVTKSPLEAGHHKCNFQLHITCTFFDELSFKNERINLNFHVLDLDCQYDIIIGNTDSVQHGLLFRLHNQLFGTTAEAALAQARATVRPHPRIPSQGGDSSFLGYVQASQRKNVRIPLSDLIDKTDPGQEFPTDLYPEDEWENPWDPFQRPKDPSTLPTDIQGDPETVLEIQALLREYPSVFARELNSIPADVDPIELRVDEEQWKSKKNAGHARPQSQIRKAETLRQVRLMLDQGLIKPSEAVYYSQILLCPKPNGTWRFCVDYRALNKCSERESWPLPNIEAMLHRIGDARPRYFAVMDATKGFFQTPLKLASQIFTAFIIYAGVYQWLRCPMGLKGAPGYFQRQLSLVFSAAGLLYLGLELYIDDIIVYGRTKEEFMSRLRRTFEVLREKRITLNPDKCKFGYSKVEYVGHTIDEEGLDFSETKKNKVLNFPVPTLSKHLKSFLGLCNYFRDHVSNYSTRVKPLLDLLQDYDKHRKLVWTEDGEQAFYEVRDAVATCAKLFFMHHDDPNYEVVLCTDASAYGLGGYLCQRHKETGVETPIQFISGTFTKEQFRWSTNEKEAYAVFYCLLKLRHLLRDIQFILLTDHKNLIYINDCASDKVARWKLFTQEFDALIEHLPGVQNRIADNFSRLCVILRPRLDKITPKEHRDSLQQTVLYPSAAVATLNVLNTLDPHDVASTSEVYSSIDTKEMKLLRQYHNHTTGHHGVSRTIDKLRSHFKKQKPMPRLAEKVRAFVKHCPCCQKMNQLRIPIQTLGFTAATYTPMERINIDTIGPLPADEHGNTYIIVIIDCFSRWVRLVACADVTAATAARIALLPWLCDYGCPEVILSDNGTQFVNHLWTALSELVGTTLRQTTPYSKEENSIVERANKEVMRHLRNILFDRNIEIKDWSLYVPLVQRIFNATEIESIKTSPGQIIYGNSIQLDRRLFEVTKTIASEGPLNLSNYLDNLLQQQMHIIHLAQKHQIGKDQAHIFQKKQASTNPTQYEIGSYVLLEYAAGGLRRGPPNKLMPFLEGPFKVVNLYGTRYTLQNLINGETRDVHVSRIRPYLNTSDTSLENMRSIAVRDHHEFVVESILDHSGDPKKKSELSFKVRWKGYTEEHDSWEPWKNLRLVEQLHDYLRSHNMAKLIPKVDDVVDALIPTAEFLQSNLPISSTQEDAVSTSDHTRKRSASGPRQRSRSRKQVRFAGSG